MSGSLTKADKMLLERVHNGPVTFTYEPDVKGHARLVRSTTSGAQQKKYHALAVAGYLSESVSGTTDPSKPPTTTISFALTALGRSAMGIRAPAKPPVHWQRLPTEEELARDAIE